MKWTGETFVIFLKKDSGEIFNYVFIAHYIKLLVTDFKY